MWESRERVRPHWESFFNSISYLGKDELLTRELEIKRLLRENGVTYNIYGDPQGFDRPWKLDLIPLLIPKKDWNAIETGLQQRARLLNLILTDIYSGRELIKKRLLPLEFIYNHTGFLRQCDGVMLPGANQLFLYGADIIRDDKGSLWVHNDRTQAPSGAGYTLENRSVMSRVLPDIFKNHQVRKLSHYFTSMRVGLMSLSPRHKENPRIVVLTPGPKNETYFEHAYLAAYMGYTLVQGDDLTVRDGFVWLKSLNGLEVVDIILRRVDDVFCDPLELKEDSQLGVAGLLEVVRKGNVSIANPLGSSILENPGIVAFLPSICRYLMNEELILPSVGTWWCGQEKEMSHVLENMDRMNIKSIYRQNGKSTISDGMLSKAEKEKLKRLIQAKPYLYVGQEKISISTTPSLVNGDMDPRFAVLRSFLVAKDGDYTVMPGGLTRSSAERDIFKVSNQLGGISKDTWVLSPEPEAQLNIDFKTIEFDDYERKPTAIPSRAAENLYWVGRYTERAKNTCRYLRVVIDTLGENNKYTRHSERQALSAMLQGLTHLTMTYPGFIEIGADKLKFPEKEILAVVTNGDKKGSLVFTIYCLKRAIYTVRDHWSMETWRAIDSIFEQLHTLENEKDISISKVQNVLDKLITSLGAFTGLNLESMTREQGFTLLDIGNRFEKSLLLISSIRSTMVNKMQESAEYSLMEFLLISNVSLNTYRYKYRSHLQVYNVLDLLLLDASHPSSLIYHLEMLKGHLSSLPRNSKRLSEEEKLIMKAVNMVQLADLKELTAMHKDSHMRKELDDMLSEIFSILYKSSDIVVNTFFTHLQSQQQLHSSNSGGEI